MNLDPVTKKKDTIEKFTQGNLYLLLGFIILMNVLLILSIHYDYYGNTTDTKRGPILAEDYFDVIDPWGKVNFVNETNSLDLDLSKCNWFTYENSLGIEKKPNVQRAITDFEDGFSHLSQPGICVDDDQIVFKRASHVCDGKGIADCIGKTGDTFSKNSKELYNYSCTNSIPLCKSTIGSISFNFFQKSETVSPINSSTRFMTFEKIFVNSDTFTKIDSDDETNFYTREGNLFSTDSPLFPDPDPEEKFYPLITYEGKEKGNFKQNIKLRRFIFKGGYREDESGPYAEIIFRPYNLYLDLDLNKTQNQALGLKHDDDMNQEFLDGIANQYRKRYKIRRMYRDNGEDISMNCTAYILGKREFVSIYRHGEDSYIDNEALRIENDDGTSKELKIRVSGLTNFTSTFILTKGSGKKWLLIPPLKLGGGKIIPRQDRSSLMRILNGPLQEETIEWAWERPADIKRNTDARNDAYHNRDPLKHEDFTKGLYHSKNKTVSSGERFLVRNFDQVSTNVKETDFPENIPNEWKLIWFTRIQRDKHIGFHNDAHHDGRSLTFNDGGDLYPNNTIELLVESVGENGVVGDYVSPFYEIEPYQGSNEKKFGSFGTRIISSTTISFYANPYNPPLLPGKRFLDGSVVWNVVDPTTEINVFSSPYFKSESLSGFPATDFTPPEESPPSYIEPIKGRINQVVYNNAEIDPPFSGSIRTPFRSIDSSVGSGGICQITIENGDVKAVTVFEGGKGYKSAGKVTVSFFSGDDKHTVSNLLTDIDDVKYTYVGLKNGTETGFELNEKNVVIKDGKISLSKKTSQMIKYGGSGFQVDDEVYIDQLDQFGNSVATNPSQLYKIFISKVDEKFVEIKTGNILSPGTKVLDEYFEYNFYEGGEMGNGDYGDSPQQIAYIHDPEITKWITTGEETQFEDFIFRGSPGGLTDFTGIYTLQFQRLNYQFGGGNVISDRENLTLGKFIPYSVFPTENKTFKEIPGQEELNNFNSVQFIPSAISDVYNRPIKEGELPTF